jgi:rod shape-determining protein MreC
VAKVTKIERDAAYSFAKITCVPSAGTEQNRQVLVLARETNLPAPPAAAEPGSGPAPKQKRPKRQ